MTSTVHFLKECNNGRSLVLKDAAKGLRKHEFVAVIVQCLSRGINKQSRKTNILTDTNYGKGKEGDSKLSRYN